MLVKIIQPGWETYSDDLGTVPFKNGVSTRHVARHEALALGSHIQIVEIDENGVTLGPVNPAFEVQKAATLSAAVVREMPRETPIASVSASPEKKLESEEVRKVYTKEELEEVASESGIAGLREIGSILGVRNTSVKGLIAEILAAQEKGK